MLLVAHHVPLSLKSHLAGNNNIRDIGRPEVQRPMALLGSGQVERVTSDRHSAGKALNPYRGRLHDHQSGSVLLATSQFIPVAHSPAEVTADCDDGRENIWILGRLLLGNTGPYYNR